MNVSAKNGLFWFSLIDCYWKLNQLILPASRNTASDFFFLLQGLCPGSLLKTTSRLGKNLTYNAFPKIPMLDYHCAQWVKTDIAPKIFRKPCWGVLQKLYNAIEIWATQLHLKLTLNHSVYSYQLSQFSCVSWNIYPSSSSESYCCAHLKFHLLDRTSIS